MPIVLARVAAGTGVRRKTQFYGIVRFGTSGSARSRSACALRVPRLRRSLACKPCFSNGAAGNAADPASSDLRFSTGPRESLEAHLATHPTVWRHPWTTPGAPGAPAAAQAARGDVWHFFECGLWKPPKNAHHQRRGGWPCSGPGCYLQPLESYRRCSLPVDTIKTGRATLILRGRVIYAHLHGVFKFRMGMVAMWAWYPSLSSLTLITDPKSKTLSALNPKLKQQHKKNK